jgi:hypothetical protein
MTTIDFITQLFCRVDDAMPNAEKHSQANLYPSEVVTLAILFALKGVGNRAFYRWLERDYQELFPNLPERTRLFRLFNTHRHWTEVFMADYSLIGIVDSYGIELIHPRREGRSDQQIGKKGLADQHKHRAWPLLARQFQDPHLAVHNWAEGGHDRLGVEAAHVIDASYPRAVHWLCKPPASAGISPLGVGRTEGRFHLISLCLFPVGMCQD